jgi:GWxTD domain-containing protein
MIQVSQRRLSLSTVTAVFILMLTPCISAAPSASYEEWRSGPARWIMTSEEQREWKKVADDVAAAGFFDIFWARRDPTPGTARNEFRETFDERVAYADTYFKEGPTRGASTDRGRVYIVLGKPTRWNEETNVNNANMTGFRGMTEAGRRYVWAWENEDALPFGRPRVEVVFLEKGKSGRALLDPGRPDFLGVAPRAIDRSLVNAKLAALPDWALRGGLTAAAAPQPSLTTSAAPVVPQNAKEEVVAQVTVPFPAQPAATAPAQKPGISRLTLLREVNAVSTETDRDPFLTIQPVETFKSGEELGWALQYCEPGAEDPLVRFALRVTGKIGKEIVDMVAPPDELVPDRVRAVPGCFMLRGAIPLDGMSAGSYTLEVSTLDAKDETTGSLERAFRIE